jgi:G6PDH family F420-dependent oxidoreductase
VTEFGYALSSEEHPPNDLVRYAQRAEAAGFTFAAISDHYHPWTDQQGQAPFVWSVLGAISHATTTLKLGTGVTCPTFRIHPAIIAQAAATVTAMMPGRFFLGVGSGENLNEHILGDHWPPAPVRQDMLGEAIAVIRQLWEGGYQSFDGNFYTVENARIYTLPPAPPPIFVAASGPKAAELAGRIGDGYWGVGAQEETLKAFQAAGGSGPTYSQVTICWAADEKTARRTAFEKWPNSAVPGQLSQDLPTPFHFEQAIQRVTEDEVADSMPCGPDPEPVVEQIKQAEAAGFSHVYVHQVGDDQEGFFRFWTDEVLPRL